MTYSSADSMVVIGPLTVRPMIDTYDLCERHSQKFTAPQRWELIRLDIRYDDDLNA